MDLLTVVLHELGHVLGLGHDEDGGVMGETLAAGSVYRLSAPEPARGAQSLAAAVLRIEAGASTHSPIVVGLRPGSAWLGAPHRIVIGHGATRPLRKPELGLAPRPSRPAGPDRGTRHDPRTHCAPDLASPPRRRLLFQR